ncbi:MAG: hypothetical protein QXI19_04665 [Candidatus Caldarchaeum sp.]
MDDEVCEKVKKIFDQLVTESAEDVVVLVEGVRDEQVLRMIGFTGRVLLASRLRSEMGKMPKRVILLLDFDREGLKNMKKLAKKLSSAGVKVDESYHKRLRILKRYGITTVESLRSLLPNS